MPVAISCLRSKSHIVFRLLGHSQPYNRSACKSRSCYSRNLFASTSRGTMVLTTAPVVEGLEPPQLWAFFSQLSSIPRPSKHEGRVIDWIKDFASQRGLQWSQDAVGNLVVKRPGSAGGEAAPPVIVQGHVDMVTEKNADTKHDFMNDPIRLVREGDWITADGTTLGADNGIGVCAALALLDCPPASKLPPIEALFTIDEETGLTGAFGLDGSLLSGRTLLNLDTEEWPEVFIGCAGGGDSVLTLPLRREAVASSMLLEVAVTGLRGGHSGVEMHEDRANAVRLAAQALEAAFVAEPQARLVAINGGDKRNAIPRECRAILAVPMRGETSVRDVISQLESDANSEFGAIETGLKVSVAPLPSGTAEVLVLPPSEAEKLLSLLLVLPHGVIKYSHVVSGLVETSSNLASVRFVDGVDGTTCCHIQCSTRSSLMPALERCRASIRRIGTLCGAEVAQDTAYPGWEPRPEAEIVQLAQKVIAEVVGRQPAVKAIHAGLECGILGEKLPGCQSVSYGPTIKGAHSPDERVQISTVKPFWEATLKIMEHLADKRD